MVKRTRVTSAFVRWFYSLPSRLIGVTRVKEPLHTTRQAVPTRPVHGTFIIIRHHSRATALSCSSGCLTTCRISPQVLGLNTTRNLASKTSFILQELGMTPTQLASLVVSDALPHACYATGTTLAVSTWW